MTLFLCAYKYKNFTKEEKIMETRNNYYEISKGGDLWIAKHQGNIVFCENVVKLEQYGVALMALTNSNTFRLYLPDLRRYGPARPRYNYSLLTPVLTGISEYRYFDTSVKGEDANGIFLLKVDDYYTFIQTDSYSWYISEEGIAEGRRKNLPKFQYNKIEFLEEFSYIGLDQFIVRTDTTDYLLSFRCSNVGGTGSQTKIVNLHGRASTMPEFTGEFIVTTENGQYMPLTFDEQEHPKMFGSIKPFSEEDKKHLLKSDKDCGYWFYDSDGNIVRMMTFDSQKSYASNSYQLDFEPAKSIHFIKRYTFDKSENIFLDVWKIELVNGEQKLLLHCKYKTILADINDFS